MNNLLIKFKKLLSEKYKYYLFLLIVFHIIFFVLFQTLDNSYQTWDSAGHIALSFRIANELKRFFSGSPDVTLVSILKISDYYPPFVQIIGAFISLLFGYSAKLLLLVTLAFFIVSIIYTYKLALYFTNSNRVAFLSAVVYSIFPQIIDQSHYYHLDIPLIALLLISTYHLLNSESLRKTKDTLIFFIFFGFAQITKWYSFLFLAAPVLICLYKGFFPKHILWSDRLKRAITIFIGSVFFGLISFPWYLLNWNSLISLVKVFSVGESDDPTTFLGSLLYYPANSLAFQILLLPMVLLLGGTIYEFFKDKKKALYYTLYIFVPLLTFIIISNKNLRYIMPLTPVFALIIIDFSLFIEKKFKYIILFLVAYLFFGTTFLSFNNFRRETPALLPISMFFAGPKYDAWYYFDPTFYSIDEKYYPVKEMLLWIMDDSNLQKDTALGVTTLIDAEHISAATFEMVRLENHLDSMYMPVPYFQFEPYRSDEEILNFLVQSGSAYIISPSNPGPEGLRNYVALKQISEYLVSSRNVNYEIVKTYDLPNGDKISIYKRKGLQTGYVKSGECINVAGLADGVESIKLEPNHTYVMFTGHFSLQNKIDRVYEPGVMNILQIENTVHQSILDVHNLPRSGSALCSREGLDYDLTEEVRKPLTEASLCGNGIDCEKVVLVKWVVGEPDVSVMEFIRGSINQETNNNNYKSIFPL